MIEADGFITVHVWPPEPPLRRRRAIRRAQTAMLQLEYRTMTERLLREAWLATGYSDVVLLGRQRARPVFLVRAAVCWVLKQNGLGMSEIGRRIGDRDHTTIINACKRAEDERRDPEYRKLCDRLMGVV